MNKMPYRYALIRFVPFPETEEFANVGVIAINPITQQFKFRLETNKHKRISDFFQLKEKSLYKSTVLRIKEELLALQDMVESGSLSAEAGFNGLVRPYQNLVQISKARGGLAQCKDLSLLVDNLYENYVDFAVAKRESAQQRLTEKVAQYVHDLNLEYPFSKQDIGTEEYSVKFPLVQKRFNGNRVIKPLFLGDTDPKVILDRSDKFLSEMKRLRQFAALPQDILVTYDFGNSLTKQQRKNQEIALEDLDKECKLTESNDLRAIENFAFA